MNNKSHSELYIQLFHECKAMVRHALKEGKDVPGSIIRTLEECNVSSEYQKNVSERDAVVDDSTQDLDTGKSMIEQNQQDTIKSEQLTLVHGQLAKIIDPALPRAVTFLDEESNRKAFLKFLGPVSFTRNMIIVAIFFLITFISFALSKDVNPSGGDIFHSSGLPLLFNLLFFISAAGLGASFAALFQASHYIKNGMFDPYYLPIYWNKFFLGLIAGLILVTLIPFETQKDGLEKIAKPTIAMLGGFSSDAVYRILRRLIDTLESFVRGDLRDAISSKEQEIKVKSDKKIAQERMKSINALIQLQQKINSHVSSEELGKEIENHIKMLMPGAIEEKIITMEQEKDVQTQKNKADS